MLKLKSVFFFYSFIITQQHSPSLVIVFTPQLKHRPTQTLPSTSMQTHRERRFSFQLSQEPFAGKTCFPRAYWSKQENLLLCEALLEYLSSFPRYPETARDCPRGKYSQIMVEKDISKKMLTQMKRLLWAWWFSHFLKSLFHIHQKTITLLYV